MKTSRLIATYKGNSDSKDYSVATIYLLEMLPDRKWYDMRSAIYGGDVPLAIRKVTPWYKFWSKDGFVTYDSWDDFTNNWEVLEIQ